MNVSRLFRWVLVGHGIALLLLWLVSRPRLSQAPAGDELHVFALETLPEPARQAIPNPPPPQPQPETTARPSPEPERAPVPPPVPVVEATTAADFFREHGRPQAMPKPPPAPASQSEPAPVALPDFTVEPIRVTSAPGASTMRAEELNPYLRRLHTQLSRAFAAQSGDFPPGLEATTAFAVLPDGRLVRASIAQSSGHAAFDAAVLRVLEGAVGQEPPGGKSLQLKLRFRTD